MKKIIYILIFVITSLLRAQTPVIFNIDSDNYDLMKSDIYYFDSEGNPYIGINPDDYEYYENNNEITEYEFRCFPRLPFQNKDIIISIDVSQSMVGNKIELAKYTLNKLLEKFDQSKHRISLILFNTSSVISYDFGNDIPSAEIENIRAVNKATNLDSAFHSYRSGILWQVQRAINRPIVVLITDGEGSINMEHILDKADEFQLYNFIIENEGIDELNQIAQASGGLQFDNLTIESVIDEKVSLVNAVIEDFVPCELSWNSNSCTTQGNLLEVFFSQFGKDAEFFPIEKDKLTKVEYPNGNTIDFGVIETGKIYSSFINIRAVLDTLIIENITSDNNDFFSTADFPIEVLPNSTYKLPIEFFASTANFNYAKFSIISNACIGEEFYAKAGELESIEDSTLAVVLPNGGESFISGTNIELQWQGIPASDEVSLEFSSNNGVSWQIINSKAKNLNQIWNIPAFESNENLLRARQLSDSQVDSRIVNFKTDNQDLLKICWDNTDSQVMLIYKSGQIEIYDIDNREIINSIRITNKAIISAEWYKFDSNLLIYQDDDESLKIYDLFDETTETLFFDYPIATNDILSHPNNEILALAGQDGNLYFLSEFEIENLIPLDVSLSDEPITKMNWNSTGNRIATGTSNGEVIVWNFLTFTATDIFTYKDLQIIDLAFNPNSTFLSLVHEGNLVRTRELGQSSNEIIFESDYDIVQIDYLKESGDLVILNSDGVVEIIDPQDKILLNTYREQDNIELIKSSFNSPLIASKDSEGNIHIWNANDFPFENITIQEDVSDSTWQVIKAELMINDIELPPTLVNDKKDTIITEFIYNPMEVAFAIDTIIINNDNFSVLSYPDSIDANSSASLSISFSPDAVGINSDKIRIIASTNVFSANITGVSIDNPLEILPNELVFESLKTGSSVINNLQISNTSDNSISIENIEIFPSTLNFGIINLPDTINPNESIQLPIEFHPQNIGVQQAELQITYFYFGYEFLSSTKLIGEGLSPKIQLEYENIISVDCNDIPAVIQVEIENSGNFDLEIHKADISNSQFTLNTVLPITITTNNSREISFSFVPESNGIISSNIELSTNIYKDSIFTFELEADYQGASFRAEPEILIFNGLAPNNSSQLQLKIVNTSNSEVIIEEITNLLPYFEILSISATTIQAGEEAIIEVNFLGESDYGEYRDTLIIKANCNLQKEIPLLAIVNAENAILESNSELDYGELNCEKSKIDSVIITNTGSTELIISEPNFDDLNFKILNEFPIIIEPNNSKPIIIEFVAQNNGEFYQAIDIPTNAINLENGIFQVFLSGRKLSPDFEIEPSIIESENQLVNTTLPLEFDILNAGLIELKLVIQTENSNISIPQSEIILPADNQATVEFQLEVPNKEGNYSYIIGVTDQCGNTKQVLISFNANEYAEAGIRIGSAKAEPGAEINIPIYLYSPEDIELPELDGYNVTISMNKSILFPLEPIPLGLINGNERFVELLELPAKPDSEGIILNMRFIATIGNTLQSELKVVNVEPIGKEITVEYQNGKFELLQTDTIDLIDYSGRLRLEPPVPNPASNLTQIEFELIEDIACQLEIYDNLGRKMLTIIDDFLEKGIYKEQVNTLKYSTGIYYIQLEAGEFQQVEKLIISR